MRTLSAKNQTDTAGPGTRPIDLLELGFSSSLRLSTGGGLSWDGKFYQASGFRLSRLTPAGGMVELPNHDLVASALVLGEGVKEKSARVVRLYGEGPWAAEDGVELFNGVMDAVPEIGAWVKITLIGSALRTRHTPRIFIAPPVCNHLPPSGTVIDWGAERFTLSRR